MQGPSTSVGARAEEEGKTSRQRSMHYERAPRFRRRARRDSPNMGWRNSSFRGFADYMQTAEFDAGLQRLIKLGGQKRSALMYRPAITICLRKSPWFVRQAWSSSQRHSVRSSRFAASSSARTKSAINYCATWSRHAMMFGTLTIRRRVRTRKSRLSMSTSSGTVSRTCPRPTRQK